jgi:hypothetical protein
MTNLDYIQNLPIERIAELTLKEIVQADYDYNSDDELEYMGQDIYYRCSDGEEYYDYDEALEHEIWWLKQERTETNEEN